MAKDVASIRPLIILAGAVNSTSCTPSSTLGNSFAGRVARENLLFPLVTNALPSSTVKFKSAPSGRARQISNIFRADTVASPDSEEEVTSVVPLISTSRSVPVKERLLPFKEKRILDRIGRV